MVPGHGQSYSSFPMSGAKMLNLYASKRYYAGCSDVKLSLRCYTKTFPNTCQKATDSSLNAGAECPITAPYGHPRVGGERYEPTRICPCKSHGFFEGYSCGHQFFIGVHRLFERFASKITSTVALLKTWLTCLNRAPQGQTFVN
jgi:hypothetical protein